MAVHVVIAILLVVAAWAVPRRVAQARLVLTPALAVDIAPATGFAALLLLATGRPLFAGVVTLALGAGLALADWTMRETLHEPAVFSEMSELPQLFTHPHLYLPFAGPGLVLGGALAAVIAAATLLLVEPAVIAPQPVPALGVAVSIWLAGWLLAREPGLGMVAAALRRLRPDGDPFVDAAKLGPFAMLLTHCVIARCERPRRRAAAAAPPSRDPARPAVQRGRTGTSLVLVQCESFFDARRVSPLVPRGLLPGFDACRAGGALFGRLDVPGWGANTMRSEFAVLTGLPEAALGYDRFNPYHAFARVPLASQIWRLRQADYRTICLHPFDRRFFRRDQVMPGLGFDAFLGRETLGGSRRPPYLADPELARQILGVLADEGPRTAIFVITIANHGPWPELEAPLERHLSGLGTLERVPQGAEFLRYLGGLRRSDEMLQILLAGLHGRDAMLGFYGDHQPSLAAAFAHFGFAEPGSDYVVWPGHGVPARRLDLPAHRLGETIVDALLGRAVVAQPRPAAARRASA